VLAVDADPNSNLGDKLGVEVERTIGDLREDLLRAYLDSIMDGYPFVVIDNEAGMEHMSRRTCQRMDVLLVVSDPTKVGLTTAGRILALAKEMELSVGTAVLVINRVRGELPQALRDAVPKGFERVALIPHDQAVEDFASSGGPLSSLPSDSAAAAAVRRMAAELK
jgi:CO dehydrogenase maturation factor